MRKTGAFRTKFLIESVADLREALQDIGSELVVRRGKPEDILTELAEEYGCSRVYAQKEHTREELDVEEAVAQKVELKLIEGHTLFTRKTFRLRSMTFLTSSRNSARPAKEVGSAHHYV